jgi:hypothetical protein
MHKKHSTMHMMTWVVVAMLVVASAGWAQSPQPNLIACTDADKTVTLTYAASSIIGKPQFALTVDGEQLFPPPSPPLPDPAGLTRIASEATVFGTFVYAMDATGTPLDEPTHVYGFFVPLVAVDASHQTTFPSVRLLGSVGGFRIPGSPAQRIDRAIEIQCDGSLVAF